MSLKYEPASEPLHISELPLEAGKLLIIKPLLSSIPRHGGVRPFHQKSTCLTQSTLGPDVAQIWSRSTPETWVNETLVIHRVVRRDILSESEQLSVALSVGTPLFSPSLILPSLELSDTKVYEP